jgi:hypothetical protein
MASLTDHLVGQFGQLPGPVRPHMRGMAEHFEDRQGALVICRLAAHHDGERAGLGAGGPAGHGRIEMARAKVG